MIALPRPRNIAALALALVPLAGVAGTASASSTPLLPDDLAFLNTPAIDEYVANAESGSADCAALNLVMTIGFISAFASADLDFGMDPGDTEAPATTEPTISADAFWAISAPVLVPLLDRVSADDASASAFIDIVGPQLVGAIYELRDVGLTDDELLLIQESFLDDTLGEDVMFGSDDSAPAAATEPVDPAMANLEARAEELLARDFESITFLDEGVADSLPGESGDELPWAAACPETAASFDFDFETDVSATFEFDVSITIPAISTP